MAGATDCEADKGKETVLRKVGFKSPIARGLIGEAACFTLLLLAETAPVAAGEAATQAAASSSAASSSLRRLPAAPPVPLPGLPNDPLLDTDRGRPTNRKNCRFGGVLSTTLILPWSSSLVAPQSLWSLSWPRSASSSSDAAGLEGGRGTDHLPVRTGWTAGDGAADGDVAWPRFETGESEWPLASSEAFSTGETPSHSLPSSLVRREALAGPRKPRPFLRRRDVRPVDDDEEEDAEEDTDDEEWTGWLTKRTAP